jgi:GNAT superfamily N-acetyltransferase
MFHVEEIGYEKIDDYIDLLIERFYWLKNHNIDMWKIEQLNKESIIYKYENPKCYLGFEDSVIVGGFLLIEQDNRYWPDKLEEKAFYIHKFVVKPEFGGKGYSHKMIEWVKELGIKNGKRFIRLDYETRRKYLREMYINLGFVDVEYLNQNKGFEIVKAEYKI